MRVKTCSIGHGAGIADMSAILSMQDESRVSVQEVRHLPLPTHAFIAQLFRGLELVLLRGLAPDFNCDVHGRIGGAVVPEHDCHEGAIGLRGRTRGC